MKLQLQMFVQDRVDETTATNDCIGLMKLQLGIERVDETTATNVCIQDRVDEITATNVSI